MTTQITQAGFTYSDNAKDSQGPKINITHAKIGPTIIAPSQNDPSTDITDSVFTVPAHMLQYAVVDSNTVQYIITLDETVGPLSVGRIGLFTDDGTLFSITALDSGIPDAKFASSGSVVGNRLIYNIYLAISGMASIANFTIQLLQLLSIPEVADESLLPTPSSATFDTYQVERHSIIGVPAIAYRETLTQGRASPAWLMSSERLLPGQGEGVIPVLQAQFSTGAPIGTIVALDYTNGQLVVGDPNTSKHILGIRTSLDEITNYGMFVDPVNTYTPLQRLYAGTGAAAGQIVTTPNAFFVGFAVKRVASQNATGWMLWVDFTGGNLLEGQIAGPPGPAGTSGAVGPPGPGSNGSCYLKLVGSNLVLLPFNGNNLTINGVGYTIPPSGWSLASTGLAANTNYYIYGTLVSGSPAIIALTTSHTTSTVSGMEIVSGGTDTLVLVGMARTNSSGTWVDSDGQMYVLSWFNRQPKRSRTILQYPIDTTSRSFVEMSTTLRNYFLTWGVFDYSAMIPMYADVYNASNGGCGSAIAFDGGSFETTLAWGSSGQMTSTNNSMAQHFQLDLMGRKSIAEGFHWSALFGLCNWSGSGNTSNTNGVLWVGQIMAGYTGMGAACQWISYNINGLAVCHDIYIPG